MESLDDKISKMYNDNAGFGSVKRTIADVKKYFPDVKRTDVEKWYRKNVDYNVVNRGMNSFVASKPLQIFQIDLFYMKSKTLPVGQTSHTVRNEDDIYTIAMGCIDIFTKYAVVVALKDKKAEGLLEALKQIFKHMGGKP